MTGSDDAAPGGRPTAPLVPTATPARRTLGVDSGVFEVPDDFDAPLPAEVIELLWIGSSEH